MQTPEIIGIVIINLGFYILMGFLAYISIYRSKWEDGDNEGFFEEEKVIKKKKRNKLKVLPLPKFFCIDRMKYEGEKDIKKYIQLYSKDVRFFKTPKIGKDGWYYHRDIKISWIEWCGISFTYPTIEESFLYELSIDDENILPKPVLDAIKVLDIYRVKSKELDEIVNRHHETNSLRNTYRESRKTCISMLKEEFPYVK